MAGTASCAGNQGRGAEKIKTVITDLLDGLGIPYEVKPHDAPVFTSDEAARQRGVRLSQIVKTMLLRDKDDSILLAVLPGDRRLDVKKLRKLSGRKNLQLMDRKAIEDRLGVVVGALAPIGPAVAGLAAYIAPAVFEEDRLDISSGDPTAGVELDRDDLKRLLAHATVAEIAKKD